MCGMDTGDYWNLHYGKVETQKYMVSDLGLDSWNAFDVQSYVYSSGLELDNSKCNAYTRVSIET